MIESERKLFYFLRSFSTATQNNRFDFLNTFFVQPMDDAESVSVASHRVLTDQIKLNRSGIDLNKHPATMI